MEEKTCDKKCMKELRLRAISIILKNYPYCSCGSMLTQSYEGNVVCTVEAKLVTKRAWPDDNEWKTIRDNHKYFGTWKTLGIAQALKELFSIKEEEIKYAKARINTKNNKTNTHTKC